jgi:predicted nucleic acid-binding protein
VSDTILVDTGAWLALFDPTEELHKPINEVAEWIDLGQLVFPWPLAYETLRTRMVRRPAWVAAFDTRLSLPSVTFIDDAEYCRDAYELTKDAALRQNRDLSMVDVLCRMLIDDPKIDIKYLVTANKKDFYDVCAANGVEIWP